MACDILKQMSVFVRAFQLVQPGLPRPFRRFPFPQPCQSPAFYVYSSNLFNRQLDYNQISCIEDGAFRALRDLEVL